MKKIAVKFWADHKVAITTGLLRIARGAIAVGASLVIAEFTKDPQFVWLAPVLLGADKAIREWSN
jgi:hypothetical protein